MCMLTSSPCCSRTRTPANFSQTSGAESAGTFAAGHDILGHRETDVGHGVQMPGLHSRDVDFVASNVVLGLVPEPGVSRQSNGRRPYAPKRAAANPQKIKDSETFLFLNLGGLAKPTSAALVVLDFFLEQHAVLIVSEDHSSLPPFFFLFCSMSLRMVSASGGSRWKPGTRFH